MVNGQRDIAMLEKQNHVVNIVEEVPPVETITGLRTLAIFSSRGQSVTSELATLMISMPNSTHRSTDFSSNGVATRMQLARRILQRAWQSPPGLSACPGFLDIANIASAIKSCE